LFSYFVNVQLQKYGELISIDTFEYVNPYNELTLKKVVINQPVCSYVEASRSVSFENM